MVSESVVVGRGGLDHSVERVVNWSGVAVAWCRPVPLVNVCVGCIDSSNWSKWGHKGEAI